MILVILSGMASFIVLGLILWSMDETMEVKE